MVAECATIATAGCQTLGGVLALQPYIQIQGVSGRAWSADLLHLNIIKLRFLPAAESVTEW